MFPKIVDYKLIVTHRANDLNTQVNKALSEGYVLHGETNYTVDGGGFFQAVIKVEFPTT